VTEGKRVAPNTVATIAVAKAPDSPPESTGPSYTAALRDWR
jgi:hypothetical protein